MTIFNGMLPPGRTVSFSLGRRGLSADSKFYGEHPELIKNSIDQIARGILDPDGGHVLVIGFQSVGKSFLIEQFASNVDQYLEHTTLDTLHLIEVSRADSNVVESLPNGVATYIEACCQAFSCRPENICLITESPDFAATVYANDPGIKVILELNISTFVHLNHREQQGASKIWSAWTIVDANEIFLKFEDLVQTLENVMVPKLRNSNLGDLSQGEIPELVEYFMEQFPNLVFEAEEESDSHDGAIMVPPGIWGLAVRKLATILAFSSKESLRNGDGSINLERAIQETFSEMAGEFHNLLEMLETSEDSETSGLGIPPGMLPPGLEESMVRIFHIGNNGPGESDDEENDEDPVVFSDISTLGKRLQTTVLGQEDAISTVVDSFSVPAAGIHDTSKPLRSFLFLGPTGVGKTQLALSIAAQVAEEPMNVIRLDMSEYAQPHEASKLLGAPSGYVGYEEGGVLTNAVRQNPRSLIILDEVEKAHYKIWDSFLQILDAGRMTDNKGRTIDFTRTIIVMTSNLGAKDAGGSKAMGFLSEANVNERARLAVIGEVEKFFRPEFINRIDEMVFFTPLSMETAREIVRREITIVSDRMEPQGFKLSAFEDNVVDEIIKLSSFSKYGARDIQRAVFKNVSQPLALRMLANSGKKSTIKLSMGSDNKIQVK